MQIVHESSKGPYIFIGCIANHHSYLLIDGASLPYISVQCSIHNVGQGVIAPEIISTYQSI